MTIYTKRGDRGKTNIFKGKAGDRVIVLKDSVTIEVLGSIDELNSVIGVAIAFSNFPEITSHLKEVQRNLLVIGAIIAGSKIDFPVTIAKKLEKIIDKLEGKLKQLSSFILPGGTVFASQLHLARSVARRTERVIVSLSNQKKINPQILVYMNRLSDFLFVMARYVNFEAKIGEELWPGRKKK